MLLLHVSVTVALYCSPVYTGLPAHGLLYLVTPCWTSPVLNTVEELSELAATVQLAGFLAVELVQKFIEPKCLCAFAEMNPTTAKRLVVATRKILERFINFSDFYIEKPKG